MPTKTRSPIRRTRPSRALLAFAALAATSSSCVTTEHQAVAPSEELLEQGPDPRAALPAAEPTTTDAPAPAIPVVTLPPASEPVVEVRALFQAGSRDDPAGREGLTALSAQLMAEATTRLSASELRAALSSSGANLSVQVDKGATVFIARAPREHAQAFLPLFLDVLLASRLDPADFARAKSDALERLEAQLRGDDERLAREALEVAIYDSPMAVAAKTPQPGRIGGPSNNLVVRHPYRHPAVGTARGLEAITLDDVKAHVRQVFTRDRLVLGVGAEADGAVIAESLSTALAALPATSPKRPPLPVVGAPLASRALLIDKDASNSFIALGFAIDLPPEHPDRMALEVAAAFFGAPSDPHPWAARVTRERRGADVGRAQSFFSLELRPVPHAERHFALRQAAHALARFVESGIPDEDSLARGVPWDRDGLRERAGDLTREEVNAAVRRHLRADRLHIVVVTQGAEAFASELVAGAPSPLAPGARPAAPVEDAQAIAAYDLKLDEGNVRVVRPEELFVR